MELSPRGHEQAASLGKYLRNKKLDAVYASPMKRAQQTLAQLMTGRDCEPVVMAGLREVDFGDWTGLSWEEVKAKFGIHPIQWLDQLEQATIPSAETSETFRGRVEPCLRQILGMHPGQNVAAVCHGGTIRMMLSILLGIPLGKMAGFEIEYASMTEVRCSPGRAEVHVLNLVPWRDAA